MNNFIDKLYVNSIDHFINYKRHLRDYAIVIIIALLLRSNVFVIYTIPTGSMIPSYQVGDVILADRLYYGLKLPFTEDVPGYRLPAIRKPQVGDVVVFRAPREEDFYRIALFVNDPKKAQTLFDKMNQASSFKRPISVENGKVNYIFDGDTHNIIILHRRVYEQFKKELFSPDSGITLTPIHKERRDMTYLDTSGNSVWASFLSTPLSGISILADVVLDTPLGTPYKLIAAFFSKQLGDESLKNEDFLDYFMTFSLYPNTYTDTTKDFVKRLIAVGGDKVQLKDNVLYVNDVKQDVAPLEGSDFSGQFRLYKETLKSHGRTLSYPVRYLNPYYSMGVKEDHPPFRSALWPYDPLWAAQYMNFSQDFGPVVIPEGYYFFMGDNRDDSLDGRYFGPVPESAVKGHPFYRILPIGRFGSVP